MTAGELPEYNRRLEEAIAQLPEHEQRRVWDARYLASRWAELEREQDELMERMKKPVAGESPYDIEIELWREDGNIYTAVHVSQKRAVAQTT